MTADNSRRARQPKNAARSCGYYCLLDWTKLYPGESSAQLTMTSHEIFRECGTELANEIFVYLQEHEKEVYRAIIQNIATQRKLRPIFIERRPKIERHEWLRQALSRKPAHDVATQTLQIWLLGAQRDLICEFLDALAIPHDGKGFVDQLPPEPSPEKLRIAVDQLLERHSPKIVAIYLQIFQTMDDAGWKGLQEMLANDGRLKIGDSSQAGE
jgi:hypothetical protein